MGTGTAGSLARRIGAASLPLLAYLGLSALLLGRHTLADPTHLVEGFGQFPAYYGRDQSFYVWSLAWMAHSVEGLSNPLLSHAVFAPVGYNLTWTGAVLGPALIMAPVTLLGGAVLSYNLLAIAAPAFAAWSAYLLARHLCGRRSAAFAGGALFGFGTYETVETINHLNLALIALIPLAVLLVLLRHSARLSRRRFICLLAGVLALQLWTSSEVFASMVVFGAGALALALLMVARDERPAVRTRCGEVLAALGLAIVLGAPYLYYAVHYPNPVSKIHGADTGTDVLNLILPTSATWLHGSAGLATDALGLHGNLTEQAGYLGLPLLVLLAAWLLEFRSSTLARWLAAFAGLALLASLGAHLVVDGEETSLPLPWLILGELPLLRFAIAGRLMLYLWLAVSVAVACWLAKGTRPVLRWGLFALVAASLLPNQSISWSTRVDRPALMEPAHLAGYVPRGSTVLALPFGSAGDANFWQMEAGFRFDLAGGYVSVAVPAPYLPYIHLIRGLQGRALQPGAKRLLCSFLRFTKAQTIILRQGERGSWKQLLGQLAIHPTTAYGFVIYRLEGARPGTGCR